MNTRPQPRDGHRMERPVITRTVPRPEIVTRCECGKRFTGYDRFDLKRQHRRHHDAAIKRSEQP